MKNKTIRFLVDEKTFNEFKLLVLQAQTTMSLVLRDFIEKLIEEIKDE